MAKSIFLCFLLCGASLVMVKLKMFLSATDWYIMYILMFVFQISFFENVAAMTLQYLDSLVQRDDMAKSQFFRGLYKVMSKLPKVWTITCIKII